MLEIFFCSDMKLKTELIAGGECIGFRAGINIKKSSADLKTNTEKKRDKGAIDPSVKSPAEKRHTLRREKATV